MRDLDRRIPVYWLLLHGSLTLFGGRSKVFAFGHGSLFFPYCFHFGIWILETFHSHALHAEVTLTLNTVWPCGDIRHPASPGFHFHRVYICAASFTHQLLTFITRLPLNSPSSLAALFLCCCAVAGKLYWLWIGCPIEGYNLLCGRLRIQSFQIRLQHTRQQPIHHQANYA